MGAVTLKIIQRKCKLKGLILTLDAMNEVLTFVNRHDDEDDALDFLLDEVVKESLKSSVLNKETVHRVINVLLEAEVAIDSVVSSRNPLALRIIDAFNIPKFCYDPIKKLFYESKGDLPIHGDPTAKASLYRDRFQLLHQRLSRDRHFSKRAFQTELSDSEGPSSEITPIQSLIGCTGRRWIMGVISQLEDGHFFLEDLTAAVEVDLSKTISLVFSSK
ncbi:unnamed protein product [Victoria cruziana]